MEITNENFVRSMKSLNTASFGDTIYNIYYDTLKKEYKDYLTNNDIPKSRIKIITKKPKDVPKKFKHQVEIEHEEKKLSIDTVLKHLFSTGNRNIVLMELEQFENMHLLSWLQSTATSYPKLAEKLSLMEKYAYTQEFKYILAYEVEGMNCIPFFRSKK